jgi:hypothetical protein
VARGLIRPAAGCELGASHRRDPVLVCHAVGDAGIGERPAGDGRHVAAAMAHDLWCAVVRVAAGRRALDEVPGGAGHRSPREPDMPRAGLSGRVRWSRPQDAGNGVIATPLANSALPVRPSLGVA